jgi:hypothetical protein
MRHGSIMDAPQRRTGRLRDPRRIAALCVLSGALGALALSATTPAHHYPTRGQLFTERDPNVAGRWAGTTSQGMPISFNVSRNSRPGNPSPLTRLRFDLRPIRIENRYFTETFDPVPPGLRRWELGGRVKTNRLRGRQRAWETYFEASDQLDLVSREALWSVTFLVTGSLTRKQRFHGFIDTLLKWRWRENQDVVGTEDYPRVGFAVRRR